jgi:hypothetical protein
MQKIGKPVSDKVSDSQRRQLERRRVLQLGIAGMPMMLSMRASAQSFAHSALDCTITIPAGLIILVNDEGAAWVTDRVNLGNGRLTQGRINRIQRRAQYSFSDGTVPDQFRPPGCPVDEDELDDDDDRDDDDDDRDDDDRDDDANLDGLSPRERRRRREERLACQYALFAFSGNTTFEPGRFVTPSGEFNVSGATGLYLVLAARFADQGANSGFPGVSCLVSILDYVNQS